MYLTSIYKSIKSVYIISTLTLTSDLESLTTTCRFCSFWTQFIWLFSIDRLDINLALNCEQSCLHTDWWWWRRSTTNAYRWLVMHESSCTTYMTNSCLTSNLSCCLHSQASTHPYSYSLVVNFTTIFPHFGCRVPSVLRAHCSKPSTDFDRDLRMYSQFSFVCLSPSNNIKSLCDVNWTARKFRQESARSCSNTKRYWRIVSWNVRRKASFETRLWFLLHDTDWRKCSLAQHC